MTLDDKSEERGPDGKIVNLADARKRQRTVHKPEKAERKGGSADKKYDEALKKQRGMKGGAGGTPVTLGKKILAVVQLVIFLAICAYVMQLCSGRA